VFNVLGRDAALIVLLAAVVLIIMTVQFVLCFKAKKLIVKLLPAILLVVAVIAFYAMIFVIQDRSAIGVGILAVVAEVLLFFRCNCVVRLGNCQAYQEEVKKERGCLIFFGETAPCVLHFINQIENSFLLFYCQRSPAFKKQPLRLGEFNRFVTFGEKLRHGYPKG